ncbi:MAG: hypothetical protein HRU38_03840 [Saccharospirillaceae bacterium]|nr:hypothetical protein [Pseudomonadales bacterium]NRB77796.1 hypothetical protein [Saccharospirillaceae bacterium]
MNKLYLVNCLVFIISACQVDNLDGQDNINSEVINNTESDISFDDQTQTQTQTQTETETETETQTDIQIEIPVVSQTVYIQEKESLNNSDLFFPKLFYFEVLVPARSEYQILVNNDVIIEATSGLGDLLGPASGLRSSHNKILYSVILDSRNAYNVAVTRNAEKQSIDVNFEQQNCIDNQTYFTQMIEPKLTQCLGCHSDNSNNSAPYSFESYLQVENYVSGHPNMISIQPTKSYHGGAQHFEENDNTQQAFKLLEYRIQHNWLCQ